MRNRLQRAIFLLFLFFLCSCSLNPGGSLLATGTVIPEKLSVSKQRHKIAFLQKKLSKAEKEQKNAQEEVERLSEELHSAQLSLINKQIDHFEQDMKRLKEEVKGTLIFPEGSHLFLSERDMLQQMMENGSPPAAFEAQIVLDRILRMITLLTENREVRH